MVTKTIPRNILFSWSTNFDVDKDGNVTTIWLHSPTDDYKIVPNAASITQAKVLITQIKAWMNSTDTWSGAIIEHWQFQDVVIPAEPEKTEKKWVQVT